MIVYSVTTVGEEKATNKLGKEYELSHARCVGIFSTLENAKEVLEKNTFDLYDGGWYPYAVIEIVDIDHLYGGFTDTQFWYTWQGDIETGKYVTTEVPVKWKHIVNWGIG